MSRKAVLFTPSGHRRTVSIDNALDVLRHGQAQLLYRFPLTVEMIPDCPEYDEERRHLAGYLVNRTYPEPLSAYDLKRLRQQRKQYRAAGSHKVAEAREFRSRRPRAAASEA